ncbi:MAG: hypothetical protein QXJ06_05555 [Candidatus Aenigmatarchaeota archaeon]
MQKLLRITNNIYDKFYTEFRSKIDEIDEKLANFQKTEDNYFITVNYLLELANRSYELFLRSKLEEKRLLIKLTLSNLEAEGKTMRYNLLKPFNYLFEYSSCLSGLLLKDLFLKRKVEFEIDLIAIKNFLS